jgi:hypothetical protein
VPDSGADRLTDALAQRTSRRGFLDRVARGMFAATGVGAVAALIPDDADAYHFCGHTYTTGSCPHPTGLPRVDAHGLPLRGRDGKRIDDLGRPVDRKGRPVDGQGRVLRDPDGHALPKATRTPICRKTGHLYGIGTSVDGAWYRCCGGHVRKLMDCCSYSSTRINGDSALTGYCYSGRKVFCVHYYQTKVPC